MAIGEFILHQSVQWKNFRLTSRSTSLYYHFVQFWYVESTQILVVSCVKCIKNQRVKLQLITEFLSDISIDKFLNRWKLESSIGLTTPIISFFPLYFVWSSLVDRISDKCHGMVVWRRWPSLFVAWPAEDDVWLRREWSDGRSRLWLVRLLKVGRIFILFFFVIF